MDQLAFAIKPEIVGRLVNRPIEVWMLKSCSASASSKSLGVCLQVGSSPPGACNTFAGLSAAVVIAIQRAYLGYGCKKASGAARTLWSTFLPGTCGDANVELDDADPLLSSKTSVLMHFPGL